jgi:hypothetical protein
MLRTHWELDGNKVRTSWEQHKSNTPHLPLKEKNLGPLGACCLTSLAARFFEKKSVVFANLGLGFSNFGKHQVVSQQHPRLLEDWLHCSKISSTGRDIWTCPKILPSTILLHPSRPEWTSTQNSPPYRWMDDMWTECFYLFFHSIPVPIANHSCHKFTTNPNSSTYLVTTKVFYLLTYYPSTFPIYLPRLITTPWDS